MHTGDRGVDEHQLLDPAGVVGRDQDRDVATHGVAHQGYWLVEDLLDKRSHQLCVGADRR